MTDPVIEKLARMGLQLPPTPKPIASFVPWTRSGSLVFLAGQVCELHGEVVWKGRVGVDFTIQQGQEAARLCGLNLLAALREACGGDLSRVTGCLRLGGFVACPHDFEWPPKVIDGASLLMQDVFGQAGRHARTAVGVSSLPRGACVEVDAVFEAA